ncbi:MAG: 30S ribosomal protein S14 [Chloroflexi bacterium]|nr:30S ribosomal protein S14 [Chloroflexota bacterium]
MAKKSQVARDAKRRAMYDKHSARRAELKAKLKASWDAPMTRSEIQAELQSMPRNSSPTRLKNRCAVTGRSRGYMRKFGLSRISFREMASEGLLPGIRKASW